MADDVSLSLQIAVLNALRASPGLTALLAEQQDGIRDHVPQDAPYPYVVLGADTSSSDDTKNTFGQQTSVQVECWARQAGLSEIKQIQREIYAVLHQGTLSITGHHLITIDQQFQDNGMDSDTLTMKGTQRFQALTQEITS